MTIPRIGAHVSVAKSYAAAADEAVRLGGDTLQIFTASPRQWRATMPPIDDVMAFRAARERLDLRPLVIHDNYLINLASADEAIRNNSIEAFRGEVARAILFDADYLVFHPGSWKNQTPEQAIERFAAGLAAATQGVPESRLMLLIENTAGQGNVLGSRLEELAALRDAAAGSCPVDIGFCIDTCHAFVSGYSIHTEDGLDLFVQYTHAALGADRVRVLHCNDSKGVLGSHLDRHEHVGKGYIGETAFGRILGHPGLAPEALILETPHEDDYGHKENIETLRRLCRKSRITPSKLK